MRLSDLFARAHSVVRAGGNERELLRTILGVDAEVSDASRDETLCLVARASLQTAIDAGKLTLNIYPPLLGRYFRLPADALISPFWFFTAVEGHPLPPRLQHIGTRTWELGALTAQEAASELEPLAVEKLPIYVTAKEAQATLSWLQECTRTVRRQETAMPADVERAVRQHAAERGGELPLADGVRLLQAAFPHLSRDAARHAIKRVLGARPQGRPSRRLR